MKEYWMKENKAVKRCPLRMAMEPGGPWGSWECIEEGCAWWTENQCAIAKLASQTVYDINLIQETVNGQSR